jgi:hypothetical protein
MSGDDIIKISVVESMKTFIAWMRVALDDDAYDDFIREFDPRQKALQIIDNIKLKHHE